MTPTLAALLLIPTIVQGSPKLGLPKVHGVTLNDSKDRVIKALGIPVRIRPHEYDRDINDNGKMIEMQYKGMSLFLADLGKPGQYKVLEIVITKPSWSIGPGFRVGQSREEAMQRSAELQLIQDSNRRGKTMLIAQVTPEIFKDGAYIHLLLDGSKVVKIELTSDVD